MTAPEPPTRPTAADLLNELEALGDERVRSRNRKLGAGEVQSGVRMGDIRALAKRLGRNPLLARELWATGHLEARLLAILLLQPKQLDAVELERMLREARFAQLVDWLQAYLVKDHPAAEGLRERFLADPDPWVARSGWSLTAGRVARSPEGLDLVGLLGRLERELPHADPATQWTMNNCLAAIGIHHAELRERAIAIGEALGLYRDYPTPKGCTSPFAPVWIAAMVRSRA